MCLTSSSVHVFQQEDLSFQFFSQSHNFPQSWILFLPACRILFSRNYRVISFLGKWLMWRDALGEWLVWRDALGEWLVWGDALGEWLV